MVTLINSKIIGIIIKLNHYYDHCYNHYHSKLEICSGCHLENVFASRSFHQALEVERMNSPTDRELWHMTPQTVNAYYHPNLNVLLLLLLLSLSFSLLLLFLLLLYNYYRKLFFQQLFSNLHFSIVMLTMPSILGPLGNINLMLILI